MKYILALWILLLSTLTPIKIVADDINNTRIFFCKTPQGAVYSQIPCKPQQINIRYSSPRNPNSSNTDRLDPAIFDNLTTTPKMAESLLKELGSPTVQYIQNKQEHWLYPNALKMIDSQRHYPEIILENNQSVQVNWLPEAEMQKRLTASPLQQ